MSKWTVQWDTDRNPEQWADEAARLRAEASASFRRSYESFERSDTDGCLTQWAADSMGRHYRACADLCDQHGMAEHNALFDLDGNLVSTRIVWGQWGGAWKLADGYNTRDGKQFVNLSKARTAQKRYETLRKKGYTVGTIRVRSGVFSRSGGPWQMVDVVEPLMGATPQVVTTDNGPGTED